jgi:hypothetical protein
MLIAIDDVGLRRLSIRRREENLLYDVLNFLDRRDPVVEDLFGQVQNADGQRLCNRMVKFAGCRSGLGDGIGDLLCVEFQQTAVSLPRDGLRCPRYAGKRNILGLFMFILPDIDKVKRNFMTRTIRIFQRKGPPG